MVNEFLEDRVNNAHNLLDNMQLEQSLWVVKNIKLRIKDKGLLGEISDKENHIEIEYKNKYNAITGDATTQSGKLIELNIWRVKEYIDFYDTLVKSHERL